MGMLVASRERWREGGRVRDKGESGESEGEKGEKCTSDPAKEDAAKLCSLAVWRCLSPRIQPVWPARHMPCCSYSLQFLLPRAFASPFPLPGSMYIAMDTGAPPALLCAAGPPHPQPGASYAFLSV